jgi:thiosulfate/3-mercaptopyruvate sulfurtransferase
MKTTSFLLLLLVGICFVSAAQDQPILVSAQWLKEHQNDPKLIILQTSFLQFEYDKEHIAGAQHLWPGWLAPDSPQGSFNAPDSKQATQVLQRLGINNDSHIVLCHVRNEVSPTARMFLTLEHFGLRGQVSFLNGGLEAWKKEGFSTTQEVPKMKNGIFKVKVGNLLVDKDYVLKTMQSSNGVIVDARMKNYYDVIRQAIHGMVILPEPKTFSILIYWMPPTFISSKRPPS